MKNFILLSIIGVAAIAASCTSKRNAGHDVQLILGEAWMTDTLFKTPESAIYDKARDRVYISNVNFEPRKKDGNGFISIISTDGDLINLNWISGLSSPKGMAIIGDTLFAADVDEIVVMDITKGEIIRKIKIDSAGMLNDITRHPDGSLYISDTDRGIIHKYENGKVSVWLDNGLNGPNGLLAEENRLLVAFQANGELLSFDYSSFSGAEITDSINRGDGIAWTGRDDIYIVTDWTGEIFLVGPGKTRKSLLRTSEHGINTADIEYIREKNLLLVPTFFKNRIIAFRLVEAVD